MRVRQPLFPRPTAAEAPLRARKPPARLTSGAQAEDTWALLCRWAGGSTQVRSLGSLVQVQGLLLLHFLEPACLVVSLLPLCPYGTQVLTSRKYDEMSTRQPCLQRTHGHGFVSRTHVSSPEVLAELV